MMRRDPTITAPISRSKRHRDTSILSPSVIVVSAMAVVTIIMSFLLARSVMILSSNNDHSSSSSSGSSSNTDKEALLLRRRTIVKEEESRQPNYYLPSPTNNGHGGGDDYKYSASALLIHTQLGDITIHFTPEYSGMSSIQYIIDVFHAASVAKTTDASSVGAVECEQCKFYRAESSLLLQGIIAHHSPSKTVNLGPCPINANYDISNTKGCPPHDPNCGCHGPIMTQSGTRLFYCYTCNSGRMVGISAYGMGYNT